MCPPPHQTNRKGNVMTLSRLLPLIVCLMLATTGSAEDASAIPAPPTIVLADLPDPYPWPSRIFNEEPIALEFKVDLDLLAPLGNKTGNGAIWFSDFAKNIGERRGEVESAQTDTRMWEFYGKERKVLPRDHPLLIEAETWVDLASWSFYPEVWPWQGGSTPIANLLFALQLGRSWVARGQGADDPELALADYRRTIRLGRLLCQDDVIFIQNLIGVALIRNGAEAIFDHSRSLDDGATAALAALVIQDCTALRLEQTRRFQRISVFTDFIARIDESDGESRTELRLPDGRFEIIVETATEDPFRALRMEAAIPLWITSHLGTPTQRETAERILIGLQDDPDPLVAAAAREVAGRTFNADEIEAHWVGGAAESGP